MTLAVVFPGQGSQRVGMGQDWLEHPAAAAVFAQADAVLGFPLSELCFNGPEDELRLTANQQPALLSVSWAIYQTIRELLPPVAFFAGHSLGEYSALVAAGALSFDDALLTVRQRGQLMQSAVAPGAGAMAAVMGLEPERITAINHAAGQEQNACLDIANFNSPEQIVVSGAAEAVAAAIPQYSAAGAKRVVELPVSAPFHSALMVPAADGLRLRLAEIPFQPTQTPVIANLTVSPYPADPAEYKLILHAQIFNPVRWTETVQYLAAHGVTHLLEVGAGKVLRMLTVKIAREIKTANIENASELEQLKGWLGEAAQ
jgi:[acyl-carrier-protein] S-malonyltransferase